MALGGLDRTLSTIFEGSDEDSLGARTPDSEGSFFPTPGVFGSENGEPSSPRVADGEGRAYEILDREALKSKKHMYIAIAAVVAFIVISFATGGLAAWGLAAGVLTAGLAWGIFAGVTGASLIVCSYFGISSGKIEQARKFLEKNPDPKAEEVIRRFNKEVKDERTGEVSRVFQFSPYLNFMKEWFDAVRFFPTTEEVDYDTLIRNISEYKKDLVRSVYGKVENEGNPRPKIKRFYINDREIPFEFDGSSLDTRFDEIADRVAADLEHKISAQLPKGFESVRTDITKLAACVTSTSDAETNLLTWIQEHSHEADFLSVIHTQDLHRVKTVNISISESQLVVESRVPIIYKYLVDDDGEDLHVELLKADAISRVTFTLEENGTITKKAEATHHILPSA